jgi:transposase
MAKTVRRRGENQPSKLVTKWGRHAEIVDRRREVWLLRVQGLSYRAIGEKLGIWQGTAYNDCKKAEEEWGELVTDPAVMREQLITAHTKVIGMLMQSLEDQKTNGQRTTQLNRDGEVVSETVRYGLSPQIAAETGRGLHRLAELCGLLDRAPEGEAGNVNVTNVMLSAPADGGGFEGRWNDANAAVDADAINADAAAIDASDAAAVNAEPAVNATPSVNAEPPATTPKRRPATDAELWPKLRDASAT